MFSTLKRYLFYHFHNPNYFFFLIILILIIVIPPFTEEIHSGIIIVELLFGLVIIMGALYASSNAKEFLFGLLWGGTGFTIFLLNYREDASLGLINAVFIFVFFQFILWKIVTYILKNTVVNANIIFACISGYLVLGIGSAPLFLIVQGLIPDAFNLSAERSFYEFTYFSFITLTSIGYGDITPNHPIAKSLTLLIGIAGQLYLTFLVAIIIGKYLVNEQINLDK